MAQISCRTGLGQADQWHPAATTDRHGVLRLAGGLNRVGMQEGLIHLHGGPVEYLGGLPPDETADWSGLPENLHHAKQVETAFSQRDIPQQKALHVLPNNATGSKGAVRTFDSPRSGDKLRG